MKLVVVDPVRLAAFTAARRALLSVVRDAALRERLEGELDCIAFRDGLVAKVPDEWGLELRAANERQAAE